MESDFPKAVQMNSLNSKHFMFFALFFFFLFFFPPWGQNSQDGRSGRLSIALTRHWKAWVNVKGVVEMLEVLSSRFFMMLFIKMLKAESFQLALLTGNNLITNSFSPKAVGTSLSHGS